MISFILLVEILGMFFFNSRFIRIKTFIKILKNLDPRKFSDWKYSLTQNFADCFCEPLSMNGNKFCAFWAFFCIICAKSEVLRKRWFLRKKLNFQANWSKLRVSVKFQYKMRQLKVYTKIDMETKLW